MAYPFYEELQKLSRNMRAGNYGLWYNKFIPIKDLDSCRASDERGNENKAVLYYHNTYNTIQRDTINKLLEKKHRDQKDFCSMLSFVYNNLVFKAKLRTPLITGIGETHPHEVSMVFDHNIGIPYIPASGIKGIVRFAHTLELLDKISPEKIKTDEKSGQSYFDDEKSWTIIPQLFGTKAARGSVIFLDAYPEQIPDLHIDIMNPHYGKYYNEGVPPADYLDPNPIKFLTVAKETVFLFRTLVNKKHSELVEKVKYAFAKALTVEGVGAKTAVGYGRFDIQTDPKINSGVLKTKQQIPVTVDQDIKTPLEKLIKELELVKANDMGRIGTIIQKIDTLETDAEKGEIAKAIRDKIGAKALKKHKQKEYMLELIAKAKK
jgi:CRISPR-associated protein Cmr6